MIRFYMQYSAQYSYYVFTSKLGDRFKRRAWRAWGQVQAITSSFRRTCPHLEYLISLWYTSLIRVYVPTIEAIGCI